MCESIGCPKEAVWVVINDVPKENWGDNGEQMSKIKL
jgi:phenylpyruvate tautomerase PptA (4-oxalocrotonate tautomerase family)